LWLEWLFWGAALFAPVLVGLVCLIDKPRRCLLRRGKACCGVHFFSDPTEWQQRLTRAHRNAEAQRYQHRIVEVSGGWGRGGGGVGAAAGAGGGKPRLTRDCHTRRPPVRALRLCVLGYLYVVCVHEMSRRRLVCLRVLVGR
jgi:hypothetical protein